MVTGLDASGLVVSIVDARRVRALADQRADVLAAIDDAVTRDEPEIIDRLSVDLAYVDAMLAHAMTTLRAEGRPS